MATKRSRDAREREENGGGEQNEGIISSFKRLINNFLFPSYGVASASAPPAPAATPATSTAQSPSPPLPERSTKRRRIAASPPDDEGSEEEQEMDEEGEEPLSQMSLAELKRRGYSLDEISRIFTGEPTASRYPAGSFATPASRPYRPATGNGAANGANGASRPMRRGTPFPPPARRAAPVGTYTPSLAPYPAPSPAKKQWSPVGAMAKSHARTPSVSKIGATPRATPSTLAGRRHVSVRKTPAGSREMPGAADTTSATAHRILATLGKIPSPLPSDRLTDARSMQKTLGKRHLETPSSSRDAENGHPRRPSVKPPPVAKRQRLDEDSFARVPHKGKTALHDDYYEREHEEEEEEEEETYREEGRTTTQAEQLRGREREESSTSFGLPKPSRTDKRPSAALPSESEPSTFISPIVASESIFSYKATTVVNGKAKEDEEEEEEQTLTKRKRKEQESPRPVGLTLKGKDEGEAAATAIEEKKEPAPFASLPSFGMASTSASSAPSTSFFAMGASSAPAAESASIGSVDFGGFAMPGKDEAAAPKTDFGGFNFGKTEGTSTLSDTFSSFIATQPSTAAAAESAPAVSFGGFSVPVAAKKDGWECACCTESNPESATSCGVCMVPRPAPKADAPVVEAAKKEEEKPTPATSFGSFLPVSAADTTTKPESPKPEASPTLKETVVAVKDKETTAAPALASPFTFGFSADTSKPKEKEAKEPAPVAEEKPALAFSAEKPKEEAKPATDLFGGFKSDFKSDFGSGSTPSFGTSTFSLTSSTPSTSLSLPASTESSATSAAATSLFAPSSSTGMQKPFMFGSTDQDKAKEEPPKQKETAAPASAPFNFGFGGSSFGAPAKKEEEDTMADSAEPSASTAASAPFGGSTFAAPSSTPAASSSIFSFGAPTETPSLPAAPVPSSGIFMFGASAPASAPAPSLTASGSFPFGSPASAPAFPAATSSAFAAPSTSSSFGGFGAPSGGGESAFSPASSVFGAPQTAAPTSTFGASAPFSPFGASTGGTSTFGSSGAFGADTGSSLASSGTFATTPFGAQPAAPASFGGSAFGAQPSAAASPFPTFGGASSASFSAAPAPAAGGAFSLGAAPAAPAGRRVVRGARRGRGGGH